MSRPFRMPLSLALVLFGTSASVQCFDPRPPPGLSCSGTGACPSGQECITGTCFQFGDASDVDPSPDADATVVTCSIEFLATGQDTGTDLDARDSTYVYWTAETGTLVIRSPKVRGPAEVFHDSGQARHPYAVATDATHVYWSEGDADGRIMRKPKDALELDPAQELATGQGAPGHIDLDASFIYWSNRAAGTINRIPKAGGVLETIATGQSVPNAILVDSARVFWLNTASGQVMRSTKEGPPFQQVADGQTEPAELALSADAVYWTDKSEGELRMVSKEGGPLQALVTNQDSPSSLGLVDSHLYWTNEGTGEVLRVVLPDGEPFLVGEEQSGPRALALEGPDIYWLNSLDSDRRVVRSTCN